MKQGHEENEQTMPRPEVQVALSQSPPIIIGVPGRSPSGSRDVSAYS